MNGIQIHKASYTIWDLDVLGNASDGYDVNYWSEAGSLDLNLTGNLDEDSVIVIDTLIESGYLVPSARDKVYVNFDLSACIEVYNNVGMPLYTLREVQ